MDKSDETSQELPKTSCAQTQPMLTIGAEQLRLWLNDHRNGLQKRRFELLQTAKRMEQDIARCDAMLAELLTIG